MKGLAWLVLENVFWGVVFVVLLLELTGWAKFWALAPLLMLNTWSEFRKGGPDGDSKD